MEGVEQLYAEMARAEVLLPADPGHAVDTDSGTQELAVRDIDGNLLIFFQRDSENPSREVRMSSQN